MASTTVLSGLELIKWQRDFMREYVRDSGFKPYMGNELTNIICVKNDLESDGYTIRIPLVGRLKGNGVTGNSTLSGNEEAMDQYYQDVTWEYYRNAITWTKKEAEKLGPRLLEEARPLLKEWASELIKYQIIDTFHKMDGVKYSAATAGNRNTWLTNNSDRVLFGKLKSNASSNVMATALATLDTTDDKMTADTVTLGKRIAKTANPHITPFKSNTSGREYFVQFTHPRNFRDLKKDTTIAAANREARAREGSGMDQNPIFQDGDLIYDGVIIREIPEFEAGRVSGVNAETTLVNAGSGGTTDVGVSFLCGQQALAFANKQMPKPTDKTETDYAFVVGKGVELAHGIEKLTWANGSGTVKDNGMVTIYCAAAPDA